MFATRTKTRTKTETLTQYGLIICSPLPAKLCLRVAPQAATQSARNSKFISQKSEIGEPIKHLKTKHCH
jgi:hypothetical protein